MLMLNTLLTLHTSCVRARGLQSPESGKDVIFWANAKFFGQRQAAKNEKKYLLNAKNGIHSVQRYEVPDIWDFMNSGVG